MSSDENGHVGIRRPWHNKGSRHERGYGWQWVKTRDRILQRDGYLCQPCIKQGRPTPASQVDHVTPKFKGGTDDDDNLQSICKDCHDAKTKAESAEAQGRKPKVKIGLDGWPA